MKAARRILLNLKTLLHGQPMFDLIRDQIEASGRRNKPQQGDRGTLKGKLPAVQGRHGRERHAGETIV
ncbi:MULTISPECIES: hypothetical protein [Gammaproteobacteria]|nr:MULTISPECIES: hypothetical protein [Gammaproteobacteria]MDX7489074.1 hypothetical protein [Serratia marcescens]PZU77789.1 MAG: hypothetical protein DI546_05150 [Rhizobium sp.]